MAFFHKVDSECDTIDWIGRRRRLRCLERMNKECCGEPRVARGKSHPRSLLPPSSFFHRQCSPTTLPVRSFRQQSLVLQLQGSVYWNFGGPLHAPHFFSRALILSTSQPLFFLSSALGFTCFSPNLTERCNAHSSFEYWNCRHWSFASQQFLHASKEWKLFF